MPWHRSCATSPAPTLEDRAAALDRYKAYRDQVEHEDQLMGIRIGWLIGSEAFLFVAYAHITTEAGPEGVTARLLDVLPALGILIAIFISFAIAAAVVAVRGLRKACPPDAIQKSMDLPPMISGSCTHAIGLIPAWAIPITLVVAWLYAAL
jgi:hypothetical protein